MRRLMVPLWFGALLLSSMTLFAATAVTPALRTPSRKPLRSLGIDEYVARAAGANASVDLFQGGRKVGLLRAVAGPSGEMRIALRTLDSGEFRVEWATSPVQVIITAAGRTYTADFDSTTRQFIASSEMRGILQAHRVEIAIVGEVMDGMRTKAPHFVTHTDLIADCDPDDPLNPCCDPFIDCDQTGGGAGGGPPFPGPPTCGGRRVIGNNSASTFGSKSLACESAADSANWQCWNQYCTGCCQVLACDSVCLLGDYLCTATVIGTSCSPP